MRSGDYYMFDDLDEKIELELLTPKSHHIFYGSSDTDDERRSRKRLTFSEVN